MAALNPRPLPVAILAGYLGAGKTTVLNHWLAHRGDLRIGAIVNDFGEINIDAVNVSGAVDELVSFAGGCLCCVSDEAELEAALQKLAEQDLDVLVIEASGLAEPPVLARSVRSLDRSRFEYAGMFLVLDAEHYRETVRRHPGVPRHIAEADLVVLNKADRVDAAELRWLRAEVAQATDHAAVVAVSQGALSPRWVWGYLEGSENASSPIDFSSSMGMVAGPDAEPSAAVEPDAHYHPSGHSHAAGGAPHAHLHDAYAVQTFSVDAALDPRSFLAIAAELPRGVVRVKGFIRCAGSPEILRRRYQIQMVGRTLRIDEAPWPEGDPQATALVLIGEEAAVNEALTRLAGTVAPPGGRNDPEGILSFHPYLVNSAGEDPLAVAEELGLDWDEFSGLSDPEDPTALDPAFTP